MDLLAACKAVIEAETAFERARRHKDERKTKGYAAMLARTNADFDKLLPSGITAEQRKMILGTLKTMNTIELLSDKFMNCARALDKMFPGFSAPYEKQREKAEKTRAESQARAERERAESQARAERERAESQARAERAQGEEERLRHTINLQDVAEFGQSEAEGIARWVIAKQDEGQPQAEIDDSVEEYRQELRIHDLIQESDIEEFGFAEAEFITKVLAGIINFNKNGEIITLDAETVEKYRRALRAEDENEFIADIANLHTDGFDYTQSDNNYSATDILLMEISPKHILESATSSSDPVTACREMQEFILVAQEQRSLIENYAIEVLVHRESYDDYEAIVSASMDELKKLYDTLYRLQKSRDFYGERDRLEDYLKRYFVWYYINDTNPSSISTCKELCSYFGGIGGFGVKKPFDAAKAQDYINSLKEFREQKAFEYNAYLYTLHYVRLKVCPHWNLMKDMMDILSIPAKEYERFPMDDELLAIIEEHRMTDLIDVIYEMKALWASK